MKYWVKNERTGEIYTGKAERYNPLMIPFGFKLYNPYNKKTVVGWNNYKANMQRSYNDRFKKR